MPSLLSRALSHTKNSRAQKKPAQKKSLPDFYRTSGLQSYVQGVCKPVWMPRDYARFADEAYAKNVIAFRAIAIIAQAGASVNWKLHHQLNNEKHEIAAHPILSLLKKPNPCMSGAEFMESLLSYRLISGNAFVQMIAPPHELPRELHLLRPDRVTIIAGQNHLPQAYRYTVDQHYRDFPVDRVNGQSTILHLKSFHPLSDWYGLSPMEAAAYSIDQHNQAGVWNQALLQNGARPTGALIVRSNENGGLHEDQYLRLKSQIDDQFTGAANAGRPLLLEGGLDWKEMSLSLKDMDFMQAKHSSARDIALAFGVPPQMLGIPGDNTYSTSNKKFKQSIALVCR